MTKNFAKIWMRFERKLHSTMSKVTVVTVTAKPKLA
jgi:hypothetical protein